jgi:hypothetical protein
VVTRASSHKASIEIVPYTAAHGEAVDRMNAKLAAGGSEWQFPGQERPADADELPVWTESFVAVEEEDAYGGYILKHQDFFLDGRRLPVGDLQLPLSLGEIDGAYSRVSAGLLFDVLRRSPHCYSLGLGSEETQFAKLLAAAGWQHVAVPFYFSVKSGNRFARSIRLPAEKRALQIVLRTLGRLGLAGVALWARHRLAAHGKPAPPAEAYDDVLELPRFERFADGLFAAHAGSYSFVGDRSAAALDLLYPPEDERFIRLLVQRAGRPVGWAVLLDTRMRDDKYFGDLRVGSLVDCFAAPEDAFSVVAAADEHLSRRGVDLVASNQLHTAWCDALEQAGYQRGPSNFFFYFSSDLAEELGRLPNWDQRLHVNRGDGEGPTHL